MRIEKKVVKGRYKTYKERADYFSFINPQDEYIYQAIALFFGQDEIPPTPKFPKKSLKAKGDKK